MGYLTPHESWEVIDASKTQTFLDCPRKYFYEYILGWRPDTKNVHLIFGSAWHEAMEYLLLNGYSAGDVLKAYEVFEEMYRADFAPEDDINNGNKTPENAFRALGNYARHFGPHDKFEVLYTEIAGTAPIDATRDMHFRIDAIVRDPLHGNQIMALEHKTASQNSRQWHNQWNLKMQTNLYTHALYLMYEASDVYGLMINGTVIRKNDEEFVRVPVRKTPENMQVWSWNVKFWLDMIQWNMDELEACTPEEPVLMAFPMNTESCTKYFGCAFHDFCTSWANPLSRCDEPPFGFKKEHWDPRSHDSTAKEVVKLDKPK